ncbi:hypothetical protein TNIN_17061 [Trichonephila inaurata madagascariensis]|uniref:Uncharacterized protein n=1 Tax=Trichonephila inaurata madagascariensis TaxID=2747483 RepID=A0A8X6I6C1_9ARAC|nr:hypothetical protein TNIN_17061 [Trichonephila inaurata madagascariensis]
MLHQTVGLPDETKFRLRKEPVEKEEDSHLNFKNSFIRKNPLFFLRLLFPSRKTRYFSEEFEKDFPLTEKVKEPGKV